MAFVDNFSNYPQGQVMTDGAVFGYWKVVWASGGGVTIVDTGGGAAASLQPQVANGTNQTFSVLVLGPAYQGSVDYSVAVTTLQQLRQNNPPNAWEVGWVIWNAVADDQFYYFSLKPIGWELGKTTGNNGQEIYQTGTDVVFPIGQRNQVEIHQQGASMTITVNGQIITQFMDQVNPYTGGRIGFYCEDSQALYDSVAGRGP